ncbi:MAG: helix-turn-helix domain-containing protein [Planctomycetota bacterium]
MAYTCSSRDHLRGNLEGANYDYVLCQPSGVLRELVAENSHEDTVRLPLAEVEKRHIMRVLSSTGGNKTRAARILGIDTKTLYNKLKIYRASEEMARKRMGEMGDQSGAMGA